MPSLQRQNPLHSRSGRAQALSRLSKSVLDCLTNTSPLKDNLHPFRCKATDPFSAVSFIHSFGCAGPTERQWHDLFNAAGALRPEDMSVVIAYVACPDNVEGVVFGSPGILDHVCRLWDEWLAEKALTLTSEFVEREACRWQIAQTSEGLAWGTGERRTGSSTSHMMVQSVNIIGGRIVEQVMRDVVEHLLESVSFGGEDQFMNSIAERGNAVYNAALCRAKTVLVESVFKATGERNCQAA